MISWITKFSITGPGRSLLMSPFPVPNQSIENISLSKGPGILNPDDCVHYYVIIEQTLQKEIEDSKMWLNI